MYDVIAQIIEIWICEPSCEKEHDASEVARGMFGIYQHNIKELRRLGLRPCSGTYFGDYKFRCQDVQAFAYACEKPIGIDYHIEERIHRRALEAQQFSSTAAYRWKASDLEERKALIRPAPRVINKPVKEQRPGYVYLLFWNGFHKIGMSRNVERRAEHILSGIPLGGLPAKIDILHTIKTEDMCASETFLHRLFSYYRVKGRHREWYSLPPHAVAWITSLQNGEIEQVMEDDLRV